MSAVPDHPLYVSTPRLHASHPTSASRILRKVTAQTGEDEHAHPVLAPRGLRRQRAREEPAAERRVRGRADAEHLSRRSGQAQSAMSKIGRAHV